MNLEKKGIGMAKGIVVYYSRTGNTKAMARLIAGAMNEANLTTDCKPVEEVAPEQLSDYDAIVLGSPCYYGHMAAPMKQLIDGLITSHGQLDGKAAGAFASAANIGGGGETTILGLIEALLIAGCVVQGDPRLDHYGPVSIGEPDEAVAEQCRRKGRRIAELTVKLTG